MSKKATTLTKETKDVILIAAGFIDPVTLIIPYVSFVKALGVFAKVLATLLRNQVPATAEVLPEAMPHRLIESGVPAVVSYGNASIESTSQVRPPGGAGKYACTVYRKVRRAVCLDIK